MVPLASGLRFEFSINCKMTVQEFEQEIIDNSEGQIKHLKMSRLDLTGQDFASTMKMSEFKSKQFNMHVDGQTYDVYPDMASIVAPNEGAFI